MPVRSSVWGSGDISWYGGGEIGTSVVWVDMAWIVVRRRAVHAEDIIDVHLLSLYMADHHQRRSQAYQFEFPYPSSSISPE